MSQKALAALCVGLAVAVVSAQQGQPPPLPTGTGLIVGQVVDALTGRGVADVGVTLVQSTYVRPGGAMAGSRPILSDGEGHFVFRGLPAGVYKITARRAGYIESLFGASTPDGDGKSITLADGGRFAAATLRLWKFGAIGGTVVDDAGEPIINLQVRAFKRNLIAGRWKFGEYYSNQKYGARTDDRGMYRIADIEPGEYIVSIPLTTSVAPASAVAELEALRNDPAARAAYTAATDSFVTGSFVNSRLPQYAAGNPQTLGVGDALLTLTSPGLAPVTPATGPWLMYQTQFYPATGLSTSATPIAMRAAQEVNGIDFSMKPVRTWRVSGTVTGLPASGAVALRLVQSDSETVLDETEVAATLSSADGAFTFVGVPAGRYLIKVLRVPRLAQVTTQVGSTLRMEQAQGVSMESTFWATVPVTVGGSDVSGIGVALSTGTRTTGRVVFDGVRPKPTANQIASVEITIELASGEKPLVYKSDSVRLAGETFQTPEIVPGKYLIRANAPSGWSLKSVTAGGQDVADTPFIADGREIPDIVVTFTDRPLSSLGGTVRSGSPASADAQVLVFPIERESWVDYGNTPRRVRRAVPSEAGAYQIPGLPPGQYFAIAVAGDRSADWRDPKHLEALSRIATRVTVANEEAKTLDLTAQRAPVTSFLVRAEGRGQRAEVTLEVPNLPLPSALCPLPCHDPQLSGPFVPGTDSEQQPPPRALPKPTPQPTGTGSISGVITADTTNPTPVRRVIVVLNSTDPRVGRTTLTDDAGRFVFASLPAARYSLTATKPGYLDARYGATKPGRSGTPIVLAESETSVVSVKITKGAVITGTLRDSRGEPVRGVAVALSQYELVNGERRLTSAGRSQPSDDRGQYRIYDLDPGEYFANAESTTVGFYRSLRQTTADELAAAERELRAAGPPPAASTPSSPLPEMGYASVFYPGTTLFSHAVPVTVGAGEEKSGIDIALQLVQLAHLSARVLGPDGQPPAMVQGKLVPPMQVPGLNFLTLEVGTLFPVTDGNIQMGGLPPGEYTFHIGGSAVAPPPMAATGGSFVTGPNAVIGLPMWATMPITIDGRDIEGLTIQLQLGKQMTGRVVFEGAAQPPAMPPAGFNVFLTGPVMGGVTLTRRGTAKPDFSIDGIIPAAYRVNATGPRGWVVKSAMVGGRDATDLPVDITSDVSDVVVTLTDKLTELSGVLQTPAGTPAANYFIVVFPKDPAYWLNGSRRIVSLRPATDGKFVTSGTSPLPPGDYLIAAVTDVTPGQWFDPAFLRALTPAAVSVTLAEGEKKRQDLQIRRTSEPRTRNPWLQKLVSMLE